jgi:nucleoside-diphosphate-sugar epimerase
MDLEPLLEGVSCVVHLAALPGVRPSWRLFDQYVESNVMATHRLLQAATAAGVSRLVLASSSSVYGNRTSGAMAEHEAPAPVSPYAVTKLAAEQLAIAYAARTDNALTTTVLRFFTVYGPRQRSDMLISRLIVAACNATEIRVFGDGSQRRDFIYVEDVVHAIDAAICSATSEDVVNVGTGNAISVAEIIALVTELVGQEPMVRVESQRAGDVALTRADVRKASELLGFRPRVSLRDGLLRHIDSTRSELAQALA